jgi:hypothetical protein
VLGIGYLFGRGSRSGSQSRTSPRADLERKESQGLQSREFGR